MEEDTKRWRRIELPAELHHQLEAAAGIVNLSTQAYAAYLISRGLTQDAQLAQIPFRDRAKKPPAPPAEA